MEVNKRTLIALSIVLALTLAVTACATPTPTPTSTPTPTLTAEGILARAREAMGKVQSYRYSANIMVESDEGVQEGMMSVEWAAPDRLYMKFEGFGEAAGQVNELIVVGERVFARGSDYRDRAWEEQSSGGPKAYGARLTMSSHPNLLPDHKLQDLRMLGGETVRGVAVFHIRGARTTETTLPPDPGGEAKEEEISHSTPPPGQSPESRHIMTMEYSLFISKSDYRVLRMLVDVSMVFYPPSAPGGEVKEEEISHLTQRVTYDFYDYDESVTIELPDVSGE